MSAYKSKVYLFLGFALLLGSCTRYHYIPRQLNLFDHAKTDKEKQVKPIKKGSGHLEDSRMASETYVQNNEMVLVGPANELVVNSDQTPQAGSEKLTTTFKNKLITPRILKKARDYNKISYHQKQIKARLQPVKSKTDDPQETESEFHPLAAISCLLGVVAWASIIAMEVYWMLFWSEYLILVSILAAIGAVVTGIIALILTKKNKGEFNNRFMAVIGLVMGGIEILVLVIALFSLLFFFGL